MNREEIKKIGLEAGINGHAFGLASEEAWQQVERFVALITSAEREACAQIVESVDNYANPMTANDCAAAIRARGQE